jgi:hypothetical protein
MELVSISIFMEISYSFHFSERFIIFLQFHLRILYVKMLVLFINYLNLNIKVLPSLAIYRERLIVGTCILRT